jgi:hypothetical protein
MTEQPAPANNGIHLLAAIDFAQAGISVVPAQAGKRPLENWKHYQSERADLPQIIDWFGKGHTGLGIITGAVSGNLEMVEAEGRAVAADLVSEAEDIAKNSGLGDLWNRICDGYFEITPSGGYHWLYQCTEPITGNQKLAQRPGAESTGREVLFETRGEGGFVVVSPTSGNIHPEGGSWERLSGTPKSIAVITPEERQAFLDIFRTLDQMPKHEPQEIREKYHNIDGTLSTGDDYNQRESWDNILLPLGWKKAYKKANGEQLWIRPGKDIGIGASTGTNEADNLYCWTSSTLFDQQVPYSKFAAFTLINFGSLNTGTFQQARKQLMAQGYGHQQIDGQTVPPLVPFEPNYSEGIAGNSAEQGTDPNKERFDLLLAHEIESQKVRKTARQLIQDEDNLAKFKLPEIHANLTIELQQPDEEAKYLINELFPTGGNITLTAEYKSGKTTLINNIVKSLADDNPFLGRYGINDHDRNIVIFNYEVEPRQYRQWMREVGIQNTDRVKLVHLRGLRMPMTSDYVQEKVIDILRDFDCQTWIVDPLARAFVGSGDENSNSDVGLFLDTLDFIKYEANVENLIVAAHTGRALEHGIERARGASRFDDWADVRWILTKNDEGQRFLKAHGRDVDMEQHLLTYEADSRLLGVDKAITKTDATIEGIMAQIVKLTTANPGILTKDLKEKLTGGTDYKEKAYKYCVQQGKIIAKQVGTTSLKMHYEPSHPSAIDEKLA